MEAAELLQRLFDEKKLNILQIFFNNPEDEFYIREVAKKAKVSVSTTFRIINQLKELELIKEHKLKKYKVYLFNKNKNSDFLEDYSQLKSPH